MKNEANLTPKLQAYINELNKKVSELENQLKKTQEDLNQSKENLMKSEALVQWYKEQFIIYKKNQFASKSEKVDENQLSLFNEIEKEADTTKPEPELVKARDKAIKELNNKKKSRKNRDVLYDENLTVERVEYHLKDSTCPKCQHDLHVIKQEVRKRLEIIPAQVKVIEEVFDVSACRNCEKYDIHTPILEAPRPKQVIPGSMASSSLIAYIMDQKYTMGLPLYRLEQQFKRWGVDISRQNMSNWMIKGAKCLEPLFSRMVNYALERDILHADETSVQVLREPGRKASTKSFMWLYRTGSEKPAIVLYDYQPTRSGDHAKDFLEGFKGYLQVDGYVGYEKLPSDEVTLVSCWAHARRYFYEAIQVQPKSKAPSQSLTTAEEGFVSISQLYEIEKGIKDLPSEKRHKIRLEKSKPILDDFWTWLNEKALTVIPKSKTGKAVNYTINQWHKLINYLKDGRLEIDNNRAERSIKPFVVGRKAWLFSNTPKGAVSSALIYSIVETAKGNNVIPFDYLSYLFDQLPNIDVNDIKQLDQLLPWNVKLQEKHK